jgi:ubiquitin carboxyl-terminal hydrolase 4/11
MFGHHKDDLNKINPLGMGGKLALAYCTLLRKMWLENNEVVTPYDLKKVLGKRIRRFSGYGQQDSAELVNYLIDLIHEDCNRVLDKPYIAEQKDICIPDSEAAK